MLVSEHLYTSTNIWEGLSIVHDASCVMGGIAMCWDLIDLNFAETASIAPLAQALEAGHSVQASLSPVHVTRARLAFIRRVRD